MSNCRSSQAIQIRRWLVVALAVMLAGCSRDKLDQLNDSTFGFPYRTGIARFELPESGEKVNLPPFVLPEDFRGSRQLGLYDLERVRGRKMAADFVVWLREQCPAGDRPCLRAALETFKFGCAEGPVLMRCALHRYLNSQYDAWPKYIGQHYLWIVTVRDDDAVTDIAVTAEPTSPRYRVAPTRARPSAP